MAKLLPFKTQPRQATVVVGTEETGQLEFPKYGSLLWYEREALRKADAGFSLFKEAAILATKIAREEGITNIDAHSMVTRILGASLGIGTVLSAQEGEIRSKYGKELSELNTATVDWHDRRTVAGVTAVIANRLPGCEDWTEADTVAKVTESMMVAIFAFVQSEESPQVDDQNAAQADQELAADLGKLPPAPGSPQKSPTGDPSTGSSDASTQEPQSSDQPSLELTPSTTSSAPSRRVSGKSANDSTETNSPSPS